MFQVISFCRCKSDVKFILYNTLNLHYVRNITSASRKFTISKYQQNCTINQFYGIRRDAAWNSTLL